MSLEVKEFIKPFASISEDLYYFSKQAKNNGEKVAGFMCTYSPQELFHAAGIFSCSHNR
jgi:benzoyl-CoA reductase/2-hydroxyglutaryl-CoA dehydratase subunit BcrC/BadD/HgdB